MATRIIECSARQCIESIVPAILAEQAAMTATGTSTKSAAFGKGTECICVQSDEAIYVRVSNDPTATTNSYKLAAGGEQFFDAREGEFVAIRT